MRALRITLHVASGLTLFEVWLCLPVGRASAPAGAQDNDGQCDGADYVQPSTGQSRSLLQAERTTLQTSKVTSAGVVPSKNQTASKEILESAQAQGVLLLQRLQRACKVGLEGLQVGGVISVIAGMLVLFIGFVVCAVYSHEKDDDTNDQARETAARNLILQETGQTGRYFGRGSPQLPGRQVGAIKGFQSPVLPPAGLTSSLPSAQQLPPKEGAFPTETMGNALMNADGTTQNSLTLQLGPSPHLCPGLVVPQGSECLVAIPTLSAVGIPQCVQASFHAVDLQGQPVVRVEVLPPDWSNGASSGQHIIVLRAISGSADLLAFCTVGSNEDGGGGKSIRIFGPRRELFGVITKQAGRPRYMLSSGPPKNMNICFEGNFAFATVTVTDESRRARLAETEPCRVDFDTTKTYYRLRTMANVDVSIMLCGLLAIDHMESS